jgi:hypothetical protein
MRTFFLNVVLIFMSFCVFGQDFGDAPELANNPVYVAIGGSWLAQSNEINLNFVKKVIYGGTLDQTTNQNIWANLKQRNQLMGHQQYGIQIRSAMDSSSLFPNGFFCVQWQQSSWNHVVFSKDVFGLSMLGNAPFTGKQLDLSGTSFTQLSYQKIGLGIQSVKNGWSIYLNGIEGRDYYQFRIDNGDVYTDPLGQFIDLNYRMVQVKSLQQNSGVGMGLDFQWQRKEYGIQWNAELNDLGWLKFRDLEKNVWKASDEFTGVSWSDAILNGESGNEALAEWTEPKQKTKDRIISLPTRLTAGVSVKGIGYKVVTYCFERQLGWQSLYFSKNNVPIKRGQLHYELALNHTFQNRYALSGEIGFENNKKNFDLSIMASELPGFLMGNSRQLMCQINLQKRIF